MRVLGVGQEGYRAGVILLTFAIFSVTKKGIFTLPKTLIKMSMLT